MELLDYNNESSNTKVNTVLVFLITYLFSYILLKGKLERKCKSKILGIDDIPGPKATDPTGILGHLIDLHPIENTLPVLRSWSEEFGDIFKIVAYNQTCVVLNSGPLIKPILQSSDMGHITKAEYPYKLAEPLLGNGLLTSSGDLWKHNRKILSKVQSYKNLKSYIPLINNNGKWLTAGLTEIFKDGGYKEANDSIFVCYLKIINEIILGQDVYNENEFEKYHHNLKIWMKIWMSKFLKPWLLFKPIWWMHPLSRKSNKAIRELHEFAERRLSDHKLFRELGVNNPFRSVLDELVDAGVDEKQIIYEINIMLLGGHDTAATVTKFLLFCLALNPAIQKECQREIDEVFEKCEDGKEFVTYHDAVNGLMFLERCVMETLRLIPVGPMFFRKLETPLTIDWNERECKLPAGTNILISPWLLQSRSDIYPNPRKFDPDRFLPEEIAKRHSHSFIPFSAGPRGCVGMKLGIIELKIIAGHIFRNFTVTTTDTMEELVLLPLMTLTPKKEFNFHFEKRIFKSSV